MDQGKLQESIEALLTAAAKATEAAERSTAAVERVEKKVDAIGSAATESHEEGRKNHVRLALAMDRQSKTIAALEKRVHGSDPPDPEGPPPLEGLAPLDELAAMADRKASSASLEVAALEGRMIRGFAEMRELTNKQSRALGVSATGAGLVAGFLGAARSLFFSAAGRRDLVKLAALVTVLLGYDQTRRPNPPPPPAPVVFQAPPVPSLPSSTVSR